MCRNGPTPTTGLSVCAGMIEASNKNEPPNKKTSSALRMGNKSQCRFVDAITQIRRLRSVVKHVPEVRLAARAMYFGALHQQAEVRSRADVFFRDGRPKAGPA